MTIYTLQRRHILFVISSPSGGGKTTLVDALRRSDSSLAYSVSTTTRPRRPAETDGGDYNFVSRKEFRRLIDQGRFLEWAEVHGNLYGTRRDLVERLLQSGRDVILDVDVQGAMSLRRAMPDAALIFIVPPSMASLEERLRRRADEPEANIAERLRNARGELQAARRFDYLVMNEQLDEAVAALCAIIAAERCRAVRSTLETTGEAVEPPLPPAFAASIIHASPAMDELITRAARVAQTDSPVLLLGESGTGKEILADAIHRASRRADAPMVRVNCGAIPPTLLESELFGHVAGAFTDAVRDHAGLFRAADGGTIFLDEIGELPLDLQVKLLRVLQDGEVRPVGGTDTLHVDVRLIAATNRDLAATVAEGRFREDLFFRISVVPLRVPSLRERRDDIPLLAEHFLQRLTAAGHRLKSIDSDALALLTEFDWPGNVRQLENAIEHAVVLSESDRIGPDDLPESIRRAEGITVPVPVALPGGATLGEIESATLRRALEQAGGNLTHAARALGITRRALTYRLDKYGIHVDRRRGRPKGT
jgi:guanylate kinase